MNFNRLIDLSHTIIPERGDRPIHAEMVPPPDFGYFPKDQWYIMHNVAFLNHTYTHIEAPYHVVKDGNDLASIPLEQLCGEAIILNLTHVGAGEDITASMIQDAVEKAAGMKEGDIVFCRFDRDKYIDDPDEQEIQRFTPESLEWLVEHGMKLMGVDTGGIELSRKDPRAAKQ